MNNGIAAWGVAHFLFSQQVDFPREIATYFSKIATTLANLKEFKGASKNASARTEVADVVLATTARSSRKLFAKYNNLLQRFPDATMASTPPGVAVNAWPPVASHVPNAFSLNALIAEFNGTKSAPAAWGALGSLLDAGLTLPTPACAYFSAIAAEIVGLAVDPRSARRKLPNVVLRTTDKGGPSVFSQRDTHRLHSGVVRQFRSLWAQEHDWERDVSDFHSSTQKSSTLTNLYQRVADANALRPDHVKRLVEASERSAGVFRISNLKLAPRGNIVELCDLEGNKSHSESG